MLEKLNYLFLTNHHIMIIIVLLLFYIYVDINWHLPLQESNDLSLSILHTATLCIVPRLAVSSIFARYFTSWIRGSFLGSRLVGEVFVACEVVRSSCSKLSSHIPVSPAHWRQSERGRERGGLGSAWLARSGLLCSAVIIKPTAQPRLLQAPFVPRQQPKG